MKKVLSTVLLVLFITAVSFPQLTTRETHTDNYKLKTWINEDNAESRHIEIWFKNAEDKQPLQQVLKDITGVDKINEENNRYYFSMRISFLHNLDTVFDAVNTAVKSFYVNKNEKAN